MIVTYVEKNVERNDTLIYEKRGKILEFFRNADIFLNEMSKGII